MDEIAVRAGYSTGAIYSNFDGKDGLLLALFEERVEPRLRALTAPLIDASSIAEQRAAMQDLIGALRNEERAYVLLLCEFWGYAARQPQVGSRFAEIRRARRRAIAGMIDQRLARRPAPMQVSSGELAASFLAAAIGVLFEGLIDEELDAEQLYGSMFALLSAGAIGTSSR